MKQFTKLGLAALMLSGSALSAQSQELHFIMCGGEVRAADQAAADEFIAECLFLRSSSRSISPEFWRQSRMAASSGAIRMPSRPKRFI